MAIRTLSQGQVARHATPESRDEWWIDARKLINRNGGRSPLGKHSASRQHPKRIARNRKRTSLLGELVAHLRNVVPRHAESTLTDDLRMLGFAL